MATIAENLQTIQTIKNNIKTSIENKGVSVGDVSFTEYSTKIDEISGGESTTEVFVVPDGIKFGNSTFTEIPSYLDFSNLTSMYNMFSYCSSLQSVSNINTSSITTMGYMFYACTKLTTITNLNTINVTNMSSMFESCSSLATIPLLDTSNVTDMYEMFRGCKSLTTIPKLDTRNVTNMSNMFYNCTSLTSIPAIDTSNVTTIFAMFNACSSLQSLPLLDFGKMGTTSSVFGTSNITTLTDLGGFKNLKINWSDNYGLYKLPNLTYDSVMNVINNLYDFRTNGDTTTTRTIKFNANSKALLSDEDIAIATNKGWVIS